MPKHKKRVPYNPAAAVAVHNRQSTDIPIGAKIAIHEVDDPFEPGARITVVRNLRDDPLARLHARRQIDEAQYQAGRAFQHDFETAESGPRAIDPSTEAVDGGRLPEPITERQQKAVGRLNRIYRELGADDASLTSDVLIHGWTMTQISQFRALSGRKWEEYFGRRFRECLDRLAIIYGFAG